MANRYCVFWLPRLFHKEIVVLDPSITKRSEEISDNMGYAILTPEQVADLTEEVKKTIHHVSVEINTADREDKNITIVSKSGVIDKEKERTVVLEYISSSRNGLIQYSYHTDNRKKEEKFISEAISGAIYHLIKGFFHVHEYHVSDADSTLYAFTSEKETDLNAKDNEALVFYLEQYERKFRGFRDHAFEQLSFIEMKNKENDTERFYNYTTRHKTLERLCVNALGESLYYKTLLHSWYNNSCKHDTDPGDAEEELYKRLHRSAVNAKNAIDSMKQIQQKNKTLYDYLAGEFTFENLELLQDQTQALQDQTQALQKLIIRGDLWAKTSVGLGVLSILLAFFSLYLVLCF